MQIETSYQLSEIYRRTAKLDSAMYYINITEHLTLKYSIEKKVEKFFLLKCAILNEMGLYGLALKNLKVISKKSLLENNLQLTNKIRLLKAFSYIGLEKHKQARDVLSSYLNSLHANEKKVYAYNCIGSTYALENNFDDAILFYTKGLKLAQQRGSVFEQARAYLNIGSAYLDSKKLYKGLKYFLLSKKIMADYKGEVFDINAYIYLNLGLTYSGLKKYNKAEYNLLKSLSIIQNNEDKIIVHKELAKLYTKKEQLEKAVSFYNILTRRLDSVQKDKSKELANIIDNQLELLNEEYKNKQLLTENKLIKSLNLRKNNLIVSLVFLVIFSSICLLISYKYIQGKKIIYILKEKERKELEKKLSLREDELDATTLAITERVNKLKNVIINIENNSFSQAKSEIQNLISSLSAINSITDRIESKFPEFATSLRNVHPELSPSELRYCLLTRLNMNLKETANILNVSPNTVKVTRSKLKKKMNVPSSISLKGYLEFF